MWTLPNSPALGNTSSCKIETVTAALRHCQPTSTSDIPCLRGVGWAPIAFDRNDRFAFAWESLPGDVIEHAFVVPADDQDGEIIDIVAWLPGRSPATWMGRAPLLGGRNIRAPRPQLEKFLMAHQSVWAWLAAGQEGIVIFDPHRAADWLEGVTLAAESIEHGQRLRHGLTRRAPPIVARRACA